MTINDALTLVDDLKPNSVDAEHKIGWLSELDKRVFNDVFARHEKDANTPDTFNGYTLETDEETQLLIPDPYSQVYRWYMEMQIDLANKELAKYNNSMAMFLAAWNDYAGAYHRAHMPITTANYRY